MTKKLLILLVAVVLVFSVFAGCTKDADTTDTTDTTDATEAPTTTDDDTDTEPVAITAAQLFTNVNARRAIAIGFDKNFIVEDIYGDKGDIVANGLVPRGFTVGPAGTKYEGIDFTDSIAAAPSNDYDKAKEYWELAKEELGFDTVVVELLTYDAESSIKIGEHLKEELERTLDGLTFELKQLPFAEKLEYAREGKYEMNWAGWGPDYQNPLTFLDMWITDGTYNEGKYSNPEYDALIQKARTATDATESWEALIAAEELLDTDYPIIPLFQKGSLMLINTDITKMTKHGFGPDYTYKYTDMPAGDDGRKVLNLLSGSDIPDMDTNATTDTVSFEVLNNVIEGIYRLAEGDVPVLAGATEVTYADGAYTIMLRDDAQWVTSTGEVYGNVTAGDYVYSWDRLVSDDLAAQYSFLLTDVLGIESYEAVDDYTLKVVVKEQALFASLMTFPSFYPVCEDFVESIGWDAFGTSVENLVFSGPFYMAEWELGSHTSLMKNTHYWEADVVKLDEIYTRTIVGVDNNTSVQLYLDGEIDRVGLLGENVALYRDRDDVVTVPDTAVYYLMLNFVEPNK